MRFVALPLILILMPQVATGQTTATTDCIRNGAFINCQTNVQPRSSQVPDYLGAMGVLPDGNAIYEGQRQAEALRAQRIANEQALINLENARAQQQLAAQQAATQVPSTDLATRYAKLVWVLRKEVASKALNGDCKGADRLATEAGDYEFAARVPGLCTDPASKPTK